MSGMMQVGFDYAALPVDSALTARAAAERIKLRLKRTVEDIIEIGRELKAVKDELPHGQFLPWIAAEFEMSERTARDFMQVHERFGGKSAIIADLKPTILYALSAPSTPDSVIDKAIEKGADTKVSDVKKWKAMEAELEEEKRRAQEFREESNERRKKIRELEQQLDLAERAEPEIKVVEKIIEKPMIPQEFSSLEDAIVAKRKDLENLDRNTQDAIQKNRTVYESRERLQREVEELTTLLSKHKASEREQVEHKRLTDSAMQFTALFIAEIQALEHAPNAEQYRRWKQVSAQFRDSMLVVEETINRLSDNPVSGELMDRVQ